MLCVENNLNRSVLPYDFIAFLHLLIPGGGLESHIGEFFFLAPFWRRLSLKKKTKGR